jgi:hypothetical protein
MSDNKPMSCFTCGRRSLFADLSRAAAKLAGARLRGVGALPSHPRWTSRASLCEFCPIRVIHKGKTYCGKPLLAQIDRGPAEGCGCPITEKAKDPSEHCPLDSRHRPAVMSGNVCNCKWCGANAESSAAAPRS